MKISTFCSYVNLSLPQVKSLESTLQYDQLNKPIAQPDAIGVMVSVLASSAVDRRFEPRSGQTKDNKIDISCFPAKHRII